MRSSRRIGSRDPVGLLLEQDKSRVPELVPVRHGRMLVSPFTFYRGAALPMAADLATTPTSGLRVQLCGDAHLSNFGAFASPERRLVFDVNDFDETLPGPFEWDVKRLAASLAVAGRDNGFPAKARRKIILAGAEELPHGDARVRRTSLSWRCGMRTWTSRTPSAEFRSQMKEKRFKATEKMVAKAHTHDSMQALRKLTTLVDGQRRIISDPPLIEPVEEVFADVQAGAIYELIRGVLGKYRRTLQSDRKHLLEQFTLVQVARKVVGVGSVGTRCLDRADGRRGRDRAVVLAAQGSPGLRPGGLLRAQPVRQPGRAGRRRAAPDAGRKRHLPRLDPRDRPGRGGPRLLRAPAQGLEILRPDRADDPLGHGGLRASCAGGPWPGPTPAPATASRWPPTSAAPASSTRRSPTSPRPTPTRTNATTPRSRPPSKTAEPRRPPRSNPDPARNQP